jgi:alpha-tubulin suppressor-like RCC1 family protein
VTRIDAATNKAAPEINLGTTILSGVAITPDQGPVAAFSATAAAGQASTFDASASSDPDGTVAEYHWKFGDGHSETTTSATTTHNYTTPGTHTVTLTVSDQAGCSTRVIFTGQTVSCNGSSAARVSHLLTVFQPGFKAVSAGGYHTCAIRTNDTVRCWGLNTDGQAKAPPGTFKAVSAGRDFTCAIRTDGAAACWGLNNDGQASPPSAFHFKAISAGGAYTCGIRMSDDVACWGSDAAGQISGRPSGTFKAVSAGLLHACAIRSDDAVACWGLELYGQASPPSGTFKAVSAGGYHSCGIRTDDTLVCWGENVHGQLDAPSGTFKAISAGRVDTCAIRTSGVIACWGLNAYNQTSPPAGDFKAISAGRNHTCAIRTDDTIACWGDNSNGQSTPPTVTERSTSTSVGCSPDRVAVGQPSTCTATVIDTAHGQASTPAGTIEFASSGPGSFSHHRCTLAGTAAAASCSVTNAPSPGDTGSHTITATYNGDATHAGSAGHTNLHVTPSPPGTSPPGTSPPGTSPPGTSPPGASPPRPSLPSCTIKPGTRVFAAVRGKAKRKGVLKVTLRCDQSARVSLGGKIVAILTVKRGRRTRETFRIPAVHASITVGKARSLTLAVPTAAIRALRAHARESVTLTLVATNGNGSRTSTARIKQLRLAR